MPALHLHCPDDDEFSRRFAAIRTELKVPAAFPAAVEQEAVDAAKRGPVDPPGAGYRERTDRRDIELVTIDPPSSLDLDQAYQAEPRGDGYRVHYAIADPAVFITPGSALDRETLERGVTLYSPDMNTLLHPRVLAEEGASLLAGADRPAVLWTLDLDSEGSLINTQVERATVRSREKLSYQQAQDRIDGETGSESLALLRTIGELREAQEVERGAVSLNLPAQEVTPHDDHYDLEFDRSLSVEGWNAQISLLTGIAAAAIMVDARVGLLRTLPEPYDSTIRKIRRAARALDIEWPDEVSYPDRVRNISGETPEEAAFLTQAARGLRGAGYVAFSGDLPEYTRHAAIAAEYAHVTAPLRRVCDRFTNEIILAVAADQDPPAWAVEALDELPSVMGKARSKDRSLEKAMVDLAEAMALRHRVGDEFDGVVVDVDDRRARLQLRNPAVVADIAAADRTLGERITVTLDHADPDERIVRFVAAK